MNTNISSVPKADSTRLYLWKTHFAPSLFITPFGTSYDEPE